MYNTTTQTRSNYTEEAFLLSSLQEVVKVWARGFGQAKFDLNICDGVADLSLNFKLGHPNEQHCEPVHLPPHPHHSHPHHHQQDYGQDTPHPNQNRKSKSQRERNRRRAAQHRAATAAVAVTAVILPFTGNLLPVNKRNTPLPLTPKDVPDKEAAFSAATPSFFEGPPK